MGVLRCCVLPHDRAHVPVVCDNRSKVDVFVGVLYDEVRSYHYVVFVVFVVIIITVITIIIKFMIIPISLT